MNLVTSWTTNYGQTDIMSQQIIQTTKYTHTLMKKEIILNHNKSFVRFSSPLKPFRAYGKSHKTLAFNLARSYWLLGRGTNQ